MHNSATAGLLQKSPMIVHVVDSVHSVGPAVGDSDRTGTTVVAAVWYGPSVGAAVVSSYTSSMPDPDPLPSDPLYRSPVISSVGDIVDRGGSEIGDGVGADEVGGNEDGARVGAGVGGAVAQHDAEHICATRMSVQSAVAQLMLNTSPNGLSSPHSACDGGVVGFAVGVDVGSEVGDGIGSEVEIGAVVGIGGGGLRLQHVSSQTELYGGVPGRLAQASLMVKPGPMSVPSQGIPGMSARPVHPGGGAVVTVGGATTGTSQSQQIASHMGCLVMHSEMLLRAASQRPFELLGSSTSAVLLVGQCDVSWGCSRVTVAGASLAAGASHSATEISPPVTSQQLAPQNVHMKSRLFRSSQHCAREM